MSRLKAPMYILKQRAEGISKRSVRLARQLRKQDQIRQHLEEVRKMRKP